MYISVFRLLLVIFSSMVAGMNVFNILSARANGQSTQIPTITFIAMLVIIVLMVVTQFFQNKSTKRNTKD